MKILSSPSCDVGRDLYSTDTAKEPYPRSPRLYVPPPGNKNYTLHITNRSSLKYLDHQVAIDDPCEVTNNVNMPGRVGRDVDQKSDPTSNWREGE